jgi:carbon-monoxide dehydrogenase large subunit
MSIFGTRVVRTEDPRLLTEGGVYVDDLREPQLSGAARLTFVRSPLAHALITGIDTSEAVGHPGVLAVYTAADMDDVATDESKFAEPLLANDRVRYAGEPVAVVLTGELYDGQDAAELVSVDYEQLPAVVGVEAALTDETLLFPDAGTNTTRKEQPDHDDGAFDACDVVVDLRLVNQRVACVPLECRATAADYDGKRLTVWHSSQNAQICRSQIAKKLQMPKEKIRVVVPDVGGGFGAKIGIDRDALVVAWTARKAGRAVRWAETRTENLLAMTQGRAQLQHVKIGGSADGKIHAYRLDIAGDLGGYPRGAEYLPVLTCRMAQGVYDIPRVQTSYRVAVTNATPVDAYRGAGRPEAAAAIERAVDAFAARIGMAPEEVRRRNFIAPEKFPFRTHSGARYDTGEYEKALDMVLEAASYSELRAEQARRREAGDVRQLGIGLSVYVEVTASDARSGETARVTVDDTGHATVFTGSSAHGQGHHTAWAMLVQDELAIPMDRVTVVHGDTDLIPSGVGTYGSRSLQLGGSAVHNAAVEIKQQASRVVAGLLEAAESDIVLDPGTGTWQVRGDPATALSWARVAAQAEGNAFISDVRFRADDPTYPFGAHVAVVEVDTETGKAELVRHITVDDAGPVLNPVLAEGQRHGGIAQGAAQALLEEVRYDSDGNPLTATLADYAAITAAELPSFELAACETPTTLNPLGVKGIGEAGTIGATPAVQNAVIDAVAHLGVRHIDMPATPERVWTAINEAGQ